MADLALVALGAALMDADHRVREEGGNNRGPRIRQYLANADPPINVAAPWCAAFVQYCTDVAARGRGKRNPLDEVRREAYVQDYWEWGAPDRIVSPHLAQAGDLVLFSFGGERWDHIGIVSQPPGDGTTFWSVEGNTGDENQRDGDVVAHKPRQLDSGYAVQFMRWET